MNKNLNHKENGYYIYTNLLLLMFHPPISKSSISGRNLLYYITLLYSYTYIHVLIRVQVYTYIHIHQLLVIIRYFSCQAIKSPSTQIMNVLFTFNWCCVANQ